MRDGYVVITDYCNEKGYSHDLRNHAFCLYYQARLEAIEKIGKDTPAAVNSVSASLLTEKNIDAFLSVAENFRNASVSQEVEEILTKRKSSDFILNTLSSVLGSMMFSILLILMFWIGRDQIRSWLSALSE